MAQCSTAGCDRPKWARGLCMNHYSNAKHHGTLPPRIASAQRAPVIIAERELGYLAGLFDGEGTVCFTLMRAPTIRRPTPKYELRVGVVMTHAATVGRFRELFGGRVHLDHRRPKTKYMWGVTQLLASRCLTTLAPDLRVKRRHVEIAAKFMATFRHENQGRNLLGTAIFKERLRLVEEMGSLNDSHWHRKRLAKRR